MWEKCFIFIWTAILNILRQPDNISFLNPTFTLITWSEPILLKVLGDSFHVDYVKNYNNILDFIGWLFHLVSDEAVNLCHKHINMATQSIYIEHYFSPTSQNCFLWKLLELIVKQK